ncbi:MAG: DUF3307 domain-containing protein [Desulfohalobiaceae bacterium]
METSILICLLAAHVLGDFLLQSARQAAEKNRLSVLVGHAVVHGLLAYALLGAWALFWLPVAIFVSHAAVDAIKAKSGPGSLHALLLDQAAHLGILLFLAWLLSRPEATEGVFWTEVLGRAYLQALVLISGFVLAVFAAGIVIMYAVQPYVQQLEAWRLSLDQDRQQPRGLQNAGQLIGKLERSLIFLFLLMGQPGGLGLLLAAKSILRIGQLKDAEERLQAEYIILGTLMSFALGIAAAYATMRCLAVV